jgi:hypothetical protein
MSLPQPWPSSVLVNVIVGLKTMSQPARPHALARGEPLANSGS